MTDYATMKPVQMLPAKVRLDADDATYGPVVDTLGWRKLLVTLNIGAAEGNYARHYLQTSADGVTFEDQGISSFLLSGGVASPYPGGINAIAQGWIDLTPEDRYVRIRVDRSAGAGVGATDEHPTSITGILLDPMNSDLHKVDYQPVVSGGYTDALYFKIDAHNRA